ncbi:hypothetical protein F7Q88_03540 [Castellaniella defragrans]|nr:hypothetical protein F7Q88_03540 [Castellaniella defragrans]
MNRGPPHGLHAAFLAAAVSVIGKRSSASGHRQAVIGKRSSASGHRQAVIGKRSSCFTRKIISSYRKQETSFNVIFPENLRFIG